MNIEAHLARPEKGFEPARTTFDHIVEEVSSSRRLAKTVTADTDVSGDGVGAILWYPKAVRHRSSRRSLSLAPLRRS